MSFIIILLGQMRDTGHPFDKRLLMRLLEEMEPNSSNCLKDGTEGYARTCFSVPSLTFT